MSKLPRDAGAFARRVRIGSARLWLLVEGRNHDQSFYDRLLDSHPELNEDDFSIRLVEQLEMADGRRAGGKAFAYSLFEYFEREGSLRQENSRGPRYIAFALDRDFEDLAGTLRKSNHILYTTSNDVESEILINGDLRRAVASAFSIPRKLVDKAIDPGASIATDLATRWREWITMRAVDTCCDIEGGVRHAHYSMINEKKFGPVDVVKSRELRDDLVSKVLPPRSIAEVEAAELRVEQMFARGDEWMLVKGKWISNFVLHLVDTGLTDIPRESNVPSSTVTKTCLETLRFEQAWADGPRNQLSALLAS